MTKIIAVLVLLIALALSGCLQQPVSQNVAENVVEINSLGFSPQTIKISAGEAVVFVNTDSTPHWPASNNHPTHDEYPEGGGCLGSKFDSCGNLKKGERFSFIFNQKGVWAYHDHLNSGFTGTVVVE